MKFNLIFLFLLTFYTPIALADEIYSSPSANTASSFQNIQYENCFRMYSLEQEQLFYLTLGAINTNKFTIDEIQTNNGYIIFVAGRHKYLATVAKIDKDNSILKITPCNNLYYFQPDILANIFKYIDSNKDTAIK